MARRGRPGRRDRGRVRDLGRPWGPLSRRGATLPDHADVHPDESWGRHGGRDLAGRALSGLSDRGGRPVERARPAGGDGERPRGRPLRGGPVRRAVVRTGRQLPLLPEAAARRAELPGLDAGPLPRRALEGAGVRRGLAGDLLPGREERRLRPRLPAGLAVGVDRQGSRGRQGAGAGLRGAAGAGGRSPRVVSRREDDRDGRAREPRRETSSPRSPSTMSTAVAATSSAPSKGASTKASPGFRRGTVSSCPGTISARRCRGRSRSSITPAGSAGG